MAKKGDSQMAIDSGERDLSPGSAVHGIEVVYEGLHSLIGFVFIKALHVGAHIGVEVRK